MKKLVIGTLVLGLIGASAFADAAMDAIDARQAAMKAVGGAAKAGDFAKMNEAAIAAKEAFMLDTSALVEAKTEASPAIWENKEGFDAIMDNLIAFSAAESKEAFGTCKACHKEYRVKN